MDQRARRIPKEYRDKAQNIDQKYCGALPRQTGPLEQRLQDFGEIACLVAGQYGEVSQHFHDLLKRLVVSKAAHISQVEGRGVSESERGLILHQLRRRLSVSIITAQSSCLLSRLHHFNPGAKDAARRRAFAKQRAEQHTLDARAHFEANIRGRRLRDIGVLHI